MEIIESESLVDDKTTITKVTISNGQFEQINTVLDRLEIDKFQEYYIFPGVCDGTQWSFTAYLASGKILKTSGSNAWPEGFEEFIRLFETVREIKNFVKKMIEIYFMLLHKVVAY